MRCEKQQEEVTLLMTAFGEVELKSPQQLANEQWKELKLKLRKIGWWILGLLSTFMAAIGLLIIFTA